jgi:4-hydroxybenzoate polyprenyltransferase
MMRRIPEQRCAHFRPGLLTPQFVGIFTAVSSAVFFIASWQLNRLTLLLSPIALGSVLAYSYTKRFTSLSHLVLGWCLAIAPTGAWIAVRGALDSAVPLLLSLAVLLWTAGFDIIYACQDRDFDVWRRTSIDTAQGRYRSRFVDRASASPGHAGSVGGGLRADGTPLDWPVWACSQRTGLLIYQQSIVRADDLSRLDLAFFTTTPGSV